MEKYSSPKASPMWGLGRQITMVLIGILASSSFVWAQYSPIIQDDFRTVHPALKDLSLLTDWGNPRTYKSGFERQPKTDSLGLTLPCLNLSDSAIRYSSFTAVNSLKTASAIDYHFSPISRYQDTILVQFDALWDQQVTIGEGGRIVVALMHSLRQAPYVQGLLDSVTQAAPFGRPAYNFRMLNKRPNTNRGGLYMFYGGGQSSSGEVEKYVSGGNAWWLPGFIAQPGGTSPGTGGDYPVGPTVTNYAPLASIRQWKRVTMRVAPEMIEMWQRNTVDSALPGYGSSIAVMAIPRVDLGTSHVLSRLNSVHGTNVSAAPIMYNWFPTVSGVRLYYRANQNAFIANFKVFGTTHTTSLSTTKAPNLKLNLFPNPTTDLLMANPDLDSTKATITNTTGQVIWQGELSQSGIMVSSWPAGLYQLKTQQGHRATFIKQ